MAKTTCDICWGTGRIQNGDGNQQPCWQCDGAGEIGDSYDDDDDD